MNPRFLSAALFASLLVASPADASRQKFATELQPLSNFQIFDIVSRPDGSRYALISDAIGALYHVEVGEYIGLDGGKIISIDKDGIDLLELEVDKNGSAQQVRKRLCMTFDRNPLTK